MAAGIVRHIARRAALRALACGAATVPLAARTARAERPADVAGWDVARWGMSLGTLDRTFAGRIRTVEPFVFGPFVATRIIERVLVSGVPFVVFFQVRPPDERLAQVLLQFRGSRPTEREESAVHAELRAQLGPPDGRGEDSDYSGTFPSYEIAFRWAFPTTRIVLRYVDPYGEFDRRVRKELLIRYTPTRPG
jgi:hypothetical protein